MSEVIGGVLCYSIAVQYGDSFGIVLLPNGVMSLVTLTPFCPDPFFLSLKCNPTDALEFTPTLNSEVTRARPAAHNPLVQFGMLLLACACFAGPPDDDPRMVYTSLKL